MTIRLLIADDHGVIRAGLQALFNAEPDLLVVGEAADGFNTLQLAQKLEPDVILVDVSMPGMGGVELIQYIKEVLPQAHTLILTVHEDEGLLREAIEAGASGYIVKRAIGSELIDAIRTVNMGNLYIHPTMTRALLKDIYAEPPSEEPSDESLVNTLTPREVEVLGFIAQGYTNRQIATDLGISVRTVEGHRANLVDKLGLQSRVDLMRYAKEFGLLE
ncbi:MAG: response regulator transcription factor [Anaerolineae bacterium]|nr:response regulator transcription factor [Anaerolineae bacterium]